MLPLDSNSVLWVPWFVEALSVYVGVFTGCIFACRQKFDIIGCIVLGFLTGFGGGILRDLLMGATDIYFMTHPELIWASLFICILTFYFRGFFINLNRSVLVADAMAVALFVLAGCNKAWEAQLDGLYIVMMGVLTGVAGGVLRDATAGITPSLFKASNFYAVAALSGAVLYELLAIAGVPILICGILCLIEVVAVRLLSVTFNWQTSSEVDFTPRVGDAAHKLADSVKTRSVSQRRRSK